MITLLASFVGFISSAIPSILKLYRYKLDLNYKLELLKLQHQFTVAGKKLDNNLLTEQGEDDSLLLNIKKKQHWLYYLNESVRPIIAYGMFFQYIWIRYQILPYLENETINLEFAIETLWDNEDMAILSGIISFYFGTKFFETK